MIKVIYSFSKNLNCIEVYQVVITIKWQYIEEKEFSFLHLSHLPPSGDQITILFDFNTFSVYFHIRIYVLTCLLSNLILKSSSIERLFTKAYRSARKKQREYRSWRWWTSSVSCACWVWQGIVQLNSRRLWLHTRGLHRKVVKHKQQFGWWFGIPSACNVLCNCGTTWNSRSQHRHH